MSGIGIETNHTQPPRKNIKLMLYVLFFLILLGTYTSYSQPLNQKPKATATIFGSGELTSGLSPTVLPTIPAATTIHSTSAGDVLQFKVTTDMTGMHPMMNLALLVINDVFREMVGVEAVITSGRDGKHSSKSLHYAGQAIDLRTRHMDDAQITIALRELQNRLEPIGFDVILEQDHFHIEYQPKFGEV